MSMFDFIVPMHFSIFICIHLCHWSVECSDVWASASMMSDGVMLFI